MENYDNKNEELSGAEGNERDIFERTSHYDPLAKKEDAATEVKYNDGKTYGDIKIKSPFIKKLEKFSAV